MSWAEVWDLLAHYRDCILRYRELLEALQRRHPEWQINYDVDSLTETVPEAAEKVAAELNNRYEIYIRLRAEHDRVEGLAATQRRVGEIGAQLQNARQTQQARSAESSAAVLKVVADNARGALGTLDARAAPDQVEAVQTAVRACLEQTDPAAAELRLADVRVRIRNVNRETAARARADAEGRDKDAVTARDLLQRLSTGRSTIETGLRNRLREVSLGDARLDDGLREQAETAIRDAEVGFADTVLRETLEQLGYEVAEGFDTLFSEGGTAFFQRPSWGEHHVRIRVDAERKRLNMHVVRYGGQEEASTEQALRDTEMEERWCSEVPRLVQELSVQGMVVDLKRKLAPGSVPVQRITDERVVPRKATSRANKKPSQQRSMPLNRG